MGVSPPIPVIHHYFNTYSRIFLNASIFQSVSPMHVPTIVSHVGGPERPPVPATEGPGETDVILRGLHSHRKLPGSTSEVYVGL